MSRMSAPIRAGEGRALAIGSGRAGRRGDRRAWRGRSARPVTLARVSRPVQRIIIVVLALLLVIPIGMFGIAQLGQNGDPSSTSATASEDDRPTMDPAEQSARPEIAKPAAPAAMQEQSAAGAEATLTYLLDSYTYMMTTGDTSVWEDSVDQDCSVCTSFLDNATTLHDQGGYLVGGEFTVHSTTFDGKGEPPVSGRDSAGFEEADSTLVDDPSKVPYALEPVSGTLDANVAWDGERWRVTDMSLTPDSDSSDGGGASDAGGAAG